MQDNIISQLDVESDAVTVGRLMVSLRDSSHYERDFRVVGEMNPLMALAASSSGRLGFDPALAQVVIGILSSSGLVAAIALIRSALDKNFKITYTRGKETLSFEGRNVQDLERALTAIKDKLDDIKRHK